MATDNPAHGEAVTIAEKRDREAIAAWVAANLGGEVRSIEKLRRWRPMWRVEIGDAVQARTILIRGMRPWDSIPYSLEHEMKVMQVMRDHDINVPEVFGMLETPHAFALEWAGGDRDPGLVQQATENASQMSPDRWQASLAYMDELARIHAIPVKAFADTEAGDPRSREEIALDHYDRNYRMLDELGAVDALVEFFTLWLRRNVPDRDERCFVTGDCGQFLNDGPEITAILDVEIGHIADPFYDLACFRGRHPVENMGDVPALYERYARASGKPLDVSAIAYHTVNFLAMATIGPMLALAEDHPGGDLMEALGQLAFIARRALEAMAEIEDVELGDVELPPARITPLEDLAVDKLLAEINRLQTSPEFPEWERNVLATMPQYLRAMIHYGPWQEEADLDDAAEILGDRAADVKEADRRMLEYVRQASPDEDGRLIAYFHRKILRLCRILAGPDATDDHLLFVKIEPILHLRERLEGQTVQSN